MTSEAPERVWAYRCQCHPSKNVIDGMNGEGSAVEYIRADLAKPKVKALEWADSDRSLKSSAESVIGNYSVYGALRSSGVVWSFNGMPCETREEAKAAAQADYERRIKGALE